MQVIPLSEGSYTIGHNKQFVPFDPDAHDLQERPSGSLLVEIQPFIVITGYDILLLDTGLGFKNKDGRMQLHANLAAAGIDPADITKVLLTHLHKDHAGGIALPDHPGVLSMPAATYYVQERELMFGLEKGKPSYTTEDFAVLQHHDRVQLLHDDKGLIDGYIGYELTGAHSPFHQIFTIRDNGETAFFGGDDAPQLQQMKHRFVAKYDYDGKKAMELRRQWWEAGKEDHRRFLFYHDVSHPEFRF